MLPSNEDNETPGTEEERLRVYEPLESHLWELRKSNIEQADKTILTLSSALLALSVTFLKDILGDRTPTHLWLLHWSWLSLILAILVTLFSFHAGLRAIDRKLKIAEDYYVHRQKDAFKRPNPWEKATGWLNSWSGILFVLGVILAVCFVGLNV